jgi:hypothetical protein
VLDIIFFSSIIYSLYEPGLLSPELVMVSGRKPAEQQLAEENKMAKKTAKKATKKAAKKR